MDKANIIPVGALWRRHILPKGNTHMLNFALFHFITHTNWWSFLRVSAYSWR